MSFERVVCQLSGSTNRFDFPVATCTKSGIGINLQFALLVTGYLSVSVFYDRTTKMLALWFHKTKVTGAYTLSKVNRQTRICSCRGDMIPHGGQAFKMIKRNYLDDPREKVDDLFVGELIE